MASLKALVDDDKLWLRVAAVFAFAVGVVDAGHYHALGTAMDAGLIGAGLTVLGVHWPTPAP